MSVNTVPAVQEEYLRFCSTTVSLLTIFDHFYIKFSINLLLESFKIQSLKINMPLNFILLFTVFIYLCRIVVCVGTFQFGSIFGCKTNLGSLVSGTS